MLRLIFLLLLALPATTIANEGVGWKSVNGMSTVSNYGKITCNQGSGWQKCGKEEDGYTLAVRFPRSYYLNSINNGTVPISIVSHQDLWATLDLNGYHVGIGTSKGYDASGISCRLFLGTVCYDQVKMHPFVKLEPINLPGYLNIDKKNRSLSIRC